MVRVKICICPNTMFELITLGDDCTCKYSATIQSGLSLSAITRCTNRHNLHNAGMLVVRVHTLEVPLPLPRTRLTPPPHPQAAARSLCTCATPAPRLRHTRMRPQELAKATSEELSSRVAELERGEKVGRGGGGRGAE